MPDGCNPAHARGVLVGGSTLHRGARAEETRHLSRRFVHSKRLIHHDYSYGNPTRIGFRSLPRHHRPPYAGCLLRTHQDHCHFPAEFARSFHGRRSPRFLCRTHSTTPALKAKNHPSLPRMVFYFCTRPNAISLSFALPQPQGAKCRDICVALPVLCAGSVTGVN